MGNLLGYPEATEVLDNDFGYKVSGTDTPQDFYFEWGNLLRPRTGYVSVDALGAAGNGVTGDSDVFNSAIAIASAAGFAVLLSAKTYGIDVALDGSYHNVKFICPSGGAKLLKLNAGSTDSIIKNVGGNAYKGWEFYGIEFDGGGITAFGDLTICLTDTSDVRFIRCKFRRLTVALTIQGSSRIYFVDSDVYGTRPGVMASGTYDPAAVSNASYDPGITVGGGCGDIEANGCRFHFVGNGAFTQGGTLQTKTRGLKVRNCIFRGDYWNGPYHRLRFSITAYNSGTKVATVAAGGLTGHFPSGGIANEVSISVQIASGSNLSLFAGAVSTTGSFGTTRGGDVIETSNGKRAEIVSSTDTQHVQVMEWESMDTHEPTSPPAANTAWRVMRYYAGSAQITDDTHLTFYFDPVNVFTGELLTAAGVSTPWSCRELPNIGYTGVHVNAGSDDTLIEGNRFRGGWGDQISIFHTEGARVIGNHVEYGQDQGLTITHSLRTVAIGNTFKYSGVSAISINQSDYSILKGNIIDSWACVNRVAERGGIQSEDDNPGLVIEGNTFSYNQTANFGGLSPYKVALINGPCPGTIIRNNTGQRRTADLYMDSAAGAGDVIADVPSIGKPAFTEDISGGVGLTIANNATGAPFSNVRNFSGFVVITDTTVTGHTGMFLIGSAGLVLVAASDGGGSVFTSTINTASRINVYMDATSGFLTIQNKLGSSLTVIVYSVRLRAL